MLFRSEFFQKLDKENKKIFLLGSSEIGQINIEYLNNYVKKNGTEFTIYNLGIVDDKPSKREQTFQKIIDSNPRLIIYGVGFRDFESEIKNEELFSPKKFFHSVLNLNKYSQFGIDDVEAPRRATLRLIQDIISSKSNQSVLSPYYPQDIKQMSIIRDMDYIKNRYDTGNRKLIQSIDDSEQNEEIKSLEKMINSSQQNKIKLIILVTPHDKFHIENINKESYQKFFNIIGRLQVKDGIRVISFYDKYKDLEIWTAPNHVAYNNTNSLIFTEDIGNLIIEEVK